MQDLNLVVIDAYHNTLFFIKRYFSLYIGSSLD